MWEHHKVQETMVTVPINSINSPLIVPINQKIYQGRTLVETDAHPNT